MNDDSISGLFVILTLIAVQAILSLAHAAIINARTSQLRDMAEEGNLRAAQVLKLVTSTDLNVTFQLLNTLLFFFIASVTVLNVADPIIARSSANDVALYTLMLIVVACFSLVLGMIVPEAVGSSYADGLALVFANPVRFLVRLCSPVVFVLLKTSAGVSSVFSSSALVNTITEEEIMTLVDAGHTGGTIEEEEKEMIYSVLQLDQTSVSEMMVPRIDIVGVEINRSLEEARGLFIKSGFSRIPVYEGNIDSIKGLLYAKDLMAHYESGKTVAGLMRPAYYIPETKRADELLKEMQKEKVHLAVVIDEYGGTAGLVTIENIIEEIIGDIQDEYDVNEQAEYEEINENEYYVDASIDIDDFNHLLDVDLPADDTDTLGGFIYMHFGRVPLEGETIELDEEDLTLHILSVEGRRIRKVHVIRHVKGEISETADDADPSEQVPETQ